MGATETTRKFVLPGSKKMPRVELDFDAGTIKIKGISIGENPLNYYQPFLRKFEEYLKNPKDLTEVHILLEFFNTASAKLMLDFFKKLEQLNMKKDKKVIIYWYYTEDDEDMEEAGEDFQSILENLTFKFKKIAREEKESFV